jgi:hypothetical protein
VTTFTAVESASQTLFEVNKTLCEQINVGIMQDAEIVEGGSAVFKKDIVFQNEMQCFLPGD